MSKIIQPEIGDRVTLEIDSIAHGGVSVARLDGRVVFVSDAIPGETVVAEISEAKKKSFARATAVEILTESPDRVAHVWPEADISRDISERVGGAEFGHIRLARQRDLKEEVLSDSMRRFGGVETQAGVSALQGDEDLNGLGYRSRVRLHVDRDTGIVGPYAARSNRVVPVATLPLANEQINLIAPLGEYMPDVFAIDVVAPNASDPRSLISYPGERGRAGEFDTVFEAVGERQFRVAAGGFWQVHREAAKTLLAAVSGALTGLGESFDPQASNLDLYGGVGLFAAAIIDAGGSDTRVTSVEADEHATDNAAENLSDTVGAFALTAKVDAYLSDLLKNSGASSKNRMRAATVLLDPPRTGAKTEVTRALASINPRNVIYIACDPVALARDTKTLTESGYSLTSIAGYDLFPHTHHFETVAVFQRD